MGAIASGGIRIINNEVVRFLGISGAEIDQVSREEEGELERRERQYRPGAERLDVAGRNVILVDDGLATGSTMRAAVAALRRARPASIIVAVPTGSRAAVAAVGAISDEIVCLMMPEPFEAVGRWYRDFGQTSDEEVMRCLAEVHSGMAAMKHQEGYSR